MSLVSISRNFLEGIGRFGHLTDRCQPVAYGKALPVAVIFGLLVLQIDNLANHPVRILVRARRSRTGGHVRPQFACTVWFAAFWAGPQNLCPGWALLTLAHAAGAFGEENLVWNGAHVEAWGPVGPVLVGSPA